MERQHAVADRPVYGKCWQLAKLVSRLDGGVKILHYTADWNGLILKGHIVDTLLFLLLAASLLFFFRHKTRLAYLCWTLAFVLSLYWFKFHATDVLPISL